MSHKTIVLPESFGNKAFASQFFKIYFNRVKKNPQDPSLLSDITFECVKAINSFFSIDFSINVITYYDSKLASQCAKSAGIVPSDVVMHIENNILHLYIREKSEDDINQIIYYITDLIVKCVTSYNFPEWNEATLTYYYTLALFKKVYNVNLTQLQEENLLKETERVKGEKVEKQSLLATAHSLACPHCESKDVQLLGLYNIGKNELKGGIPLITGKTEDLKMMAYYECHSCHNVFFTEPKPAEKS
jgi:hypothetical protein